MAIYHPHPNLPPIKGEGTMAIYHPHPNLPPIKGEGTMAIYHPHPNLPPSRGKGTMAIYYPPILTFPHQGGRDLFRGSLILCPDIAYRQGDVVIFNVIPVKTGIQMLFEPRNYFREWRIVDYGFHRNDENKDCGFRPRIGVPGVPGVPSDVLPPE